MPDRNRSDLTFNRRRALGIAAGSLGFSPAAMVSETDASQDRDVSYYVPRIVRAPFSERNVDALIEALALLGIAVIADPNDSQPIVPLALPQSPLWLLEFQARNMALEVAMGSGTPGSELDAVFPAVEGLPPVSFLLAGYVAAGQTAASAFVRELLGEQDWADVTYHDCRSSSV